MAQISLYLFYGDTAKIIANKQRLLEIMRMLIICEIVNKRYSFSVVRRRTGNAGNTAFCSTRPASEEKVNAYHVAINLKLIDRLISGLTFLVVTLTPKEAFRTVPCKIHDKKKPTTWR